MHTWTYPCCCSITACLGQTPLLPGKLNQQQGRKHSKAHWVGLQIPDGFLIMILFREHHLCLKEVHESWVKNITKCSLTSARLCQILGSTSLAKYFS